jgi:hypothetical protein
VTGGWQGDQGGGYGGGWQPHQDPYQQPQQDPYQQPQYGPPYDPYAQYRQDPYAGQAYPAYGPGFGEPPPPPKKSRLPIVLSIIAIVAIIGGVVAIVLLNRKDDPAPAANAGPSTSNRPASPSKAPPPGTSRRPPTSGAKPPPTKDGWTTVNLSDGTGSYQTPSDWKASPTKKDSGLGVQFGDVTEAGTYDCGGHSYFRGFTASSEVQGKDGAELDVNKAVTDFANAFAGKYYNSPKIDLPSPTATTVTGKKAATVTAKLTVTPTSAECEATSGEVAVVGVAIEKGGKVTGVRMLVVVNDLAGGPATPKPLPDPLAEEILGTLTVG